MDSPVIEYVKSSQNICLYSIISILLIFFFMISPINKLLMTSFLGKISILILLGYIIFYNIILTNKLSNKMNISLINGKWNTVKTNLTCSYIFSLCLFILFISVLRCLF
jgi:NADH:ubiquinone oxidoreductase subunit 6 (subunit J)